MNLQFAATSTFPAVIALQKWKTNLVIVSLKKPD